MRDLLKNVSYWAKNNMYVESLAVVGSYARGEERPDSDINLVIFTEDAKELIDNHRFIHFFGLVQNTKKEIKGPITSIRAKYYNDCEVGFGICNLNLLEGNLDESIIKCAKQGYQILVDKQDRLKKILEEKAL